MPDEIPPRYNEAARYALKRIHTIGFLQFLVPEAFAHWEFDGWVDSQAVSFPGEPERRCDTVVRFQRIKKDRMPVALVVEFELSPSSEMPPREGEYCFRVRREVPFHIDPKVSYDVVGAIVFLTGPAQPTSWCMRPEDFGGLGITIDCAVPCLRDLDATQTLARIAKKEQTPALIVYTPLMGNSDTKEVAEACRDLIQADLDAERRKDMVAVTLTFANLNPKPEIWRAAFKEFQMEADTAPFLVGYVQKGKTEGIAEGKAESATELRTLLYTLLTDHLKSPVPESIRAWIEKQKSVATLGTWCGNHWRCADWDAVRKMLGMPIAD